MDAYRLRLPDALLVALAVVLTLASGYIHFWVGGTLLLLNAAGYLALALGVVATAVALKRALPLVLVALAGYAAVTIVGWLILGPYFDIAYLAKGIEIALITTVAVWVARNRSWTAWAVRWAVRRVVA